MGKSSKHKSQNVHHFVTFSERILKVNTDVIHQLRRIDRQSDDTFFGEALLKWTDLDMTDHFGNFRKEIQGQVQTFEQLVHNKDNILDALKKHLAVSGSLAVTALLDLLVHLARDLQQDFVPHFHEFFTILVNLLKIHSKDADILEQVFQTLAFLFRFLWRYLVKDFATVFRYFSHLLQSSQKDYILVFAAESCAYLLRKVKRQDQLLNVLLGSLKTDQELVNGIGLLLFEMMKGVKHHFHTISQKVFPLILQRLGPWSPQGKKKQDLPYHLVESAVTLLMQECAEHTTKEHCKSLWDMLLDVIGQVSDACFNNQANEDSNSDDASGSVQHLCRLLRLVSVWITHNNGSIVSNAEHIAEALCSILKSASTRHLASLDTDLLKTITNLLTTCHGRLSVEKIFQLNSLVFTVPVKFSALKNFVASLQNLPFFEKDVLPRLVSRLHTTLPLEDTDQKHEVLAFMTELVLLKIKSPITGDDLDQLKTYCLDRSLSRSLRENSFSAYIDSIVDSALEQDKLLSASDLSVLWGAVVCSPHWSTSPLQNKSSLWKQLVVQLKQCKDDTILEMILALLNQLLRSILTIVMEQKVDILPVEYEDILDILRLRPVSPFSIQMMDLYLSCPQTSSLLTEQELNKIYALLEPNLVSPSHNIRLITCHILSAFPVDLQDYSDGVTRESAFKIMYEAEKLVPTVHNYREKLIHLRKLEYEVIVKCLPSRDFYKAALLFLMGNEFWNFKLMWAPLSDIIASHAHGPDAGEFWEVMLGQLKRASLVAEKELKTKEKSPSSVVHTNTLKLLENHMSQFTTDKRQPDFTNFRVQLWRTLKKFPEKCILRSDELCELYLNFLKNEFYVDDEDSRSYQNIKDCNTLENQQQIEIDSAEVETEVPMDVTDNHEDDDLADTSVIHAAKKNKIKPRKANIQSLLVHLDLFATFKKQRALLNTPQVQSTFYDLLKHRHSSVQKAAFECVLSYKNPHITPYRENFNRLLEDTTFKSEIVLFRVDEESAQVKEIDRAELIPVLMRILYGKFHGKAGNNTSGNARSNLRRTIIFGFLCGCKSEELQYFLDLLFEQFKHFVTDDPVKMVSNIQEYVDVEKFLPLKRIKGVLNTVQIVSQKLGIRLESSAHSLLHILVGLATTVSAALIQRQVLLKGVVNLLKTLHHTAVNRITQFFINFESFDYTSSEIEAVFSAIVWPQMRKLAFEGVHHPTPILKLFLFWSRSKRFSPLLSHFKEATTCSYTPLSAIFSLLNAPKLNPSVEEVILDLINNLLEEAEDDDGAQKPTPLPAPFAQSHDVEQEQAGKQLLMPHISNLLAYLQSSLSRASKGKQLFTVELKILARISVFVTDPKQCHSLCDLLILLFSKETNLSQDMEENVLLSLTNLIQYIDKPESFYRTVSQLFCTVGRRESRSLLCKLFKVISEKNTSLTTVANLVDKLNAWDRRKAEEPDYLVRLEAFSEINAMFLDKEVCTTDAILPVVYNCCHFINSVDDLSIRDNATHCLISIATQVIATAADCSKTFNIVIEKTLVPQIKLGIRNKSETVRHEFLAVLQSLVNGCPNHQMFTGLKDLCDKDPEADFFENIRHIQIHKRSRAFRRLYKHLKDHQFRSEIHMSYFIPLVYAFIIDQTYSKYANLQDAAVDLLGAICKQLPWQNYLQLLRFYLGSLSKKVELQRQLIRVIVTLLDAFRYDLRNSKYTTTQTPKAVSGNYVDSFEEMQSQNDKLGEDTTEHKQGESEEVVEMISPQFATITPDDTEKIEENATGSEIIICSSAAATRIHKTIATSLLPQLHSIVSQKAKSDDEHKLVKSKYPEDEEILRIPVALAMIKLLQNLPPGALESMLPGILLKICAFLRCRARDVRTTARGTLEKVTLSLGARFMPFIFRELKSTLTRGYQLHVLSYTAYRLLKVASTVLKSGDLDPALGHVQEIVFSELFGQVADEKEVAAIKAKYFEAQFIKGYDVYGLLARFVSPGRLHQLLAPIRGILESTHNRRTANKAETVLVKISHGLMANDSIPIETMMVFINSLVSLQLTDNLEQNWPKTQQHSKALSQPRAPESCLLLPQAIPRGGFKPKASKRTNIHVLVEFGLQLLNMCLKKTLLLPSEHQHLQLLDPLIPAIRDCLSSVHVKTSSNSMRCLSWLLTFALPSLKENISKIVQGMFVVLQNNAGVATAKGGNQELISMCFKAVTVLVRDVVYYEITENQLQVLLTYCEEDLYNYNRQSSAFHLIRAILSRKLDTPQLHQVIDKLFEMSVTAKSTSVRLQCRQVILFYLLNYPIGKNLKKHLHFYLDNMNYELEDGRESTLEMFISMFSAFPQKILNNHCPKFFVVLAMASFNDASVKCRKLIFVALRTLIGKIDLKRRKTLFSNVVTWMKSDVIDVRTMGFHVCGLFVEVEGGKFEFYLKEIVPIVQLQLNPDRYTGKDEDAVKTEQEDLCLLAVLNTFMKVVRELSIVRQADLTEELNEIWEHIRHHLTYPHAQVRLVSSQLIGLLLSAWEPAEIAEQSVEGEATSDSCQQSSFMLQNTVQLVKNFCKALCHQLQTPHLDDILGTQVVKNLLYLARLAEALGRLDVLALIVKKVMKEANMEVIHSVKITLKRNYAFKWAAAVGVSLSPQSVQSVLTFLLPPLQRELLAQAQDEKLKNLAQEVTDLLKKQVGVPEFTAAFASCHQWRVEKREVKKRLIAAEAVTDPDIAARKKIRHNLKKREAVKRKIAQSRPTKRIKKNKLSILNVPVDDE